MINDLQALQAHFKRQGFSYDDQNGTNDVHANDSVDFHQRYFRSDLETLSIIKDRYKVPIEERMEGYEEPNNASAVRQYDVVRQQIQKWLQNGVVVKCKEKPLYVNPLSVVSKVDWLTKETKYRVVLDASRCLNLKVNVPHFVPDDLGYFEPLLSKDVYMTSFDITSMYHHVRLSEESQQFFGFAVPTTEGVIEYFIFTRMQFGYSPASYVLGKVMGAPLNFARGLGLTVGIFVDDGLLIHKNPKVLFYQTEFLIAVLQYAGWNISFPKSQLIPTKEIVYQGFIIDSVKFQYILPELKRQIILDKLDNCLGLARVGITIPARELAGIIGKITACRKAFGPVLQIAMRHTQNTLGRSVLEGRELDNPNWEVDVHMDSAAIEELALCRSIIAGKNGYSIPTERESLTINSRNQVITKSGKVMEEQHELVVSDASERVAFVYEANKWKIVEEFVLEEGERALSSGHRELKAVVKTIERHADFLAQGARKIYWATDSKNVCAFLERGSKKADIQKDVIDIKLAERSMGIEIEPIWLPRESQQIDMADIGSKLSISTDEWSIDRKTYNTATNYLGLRPTVDAMATDRNKMCSKFFSAIPQQGSSGINFFAQKLSPREIY